ncbi:MAG: NADH:flavin oxidoreductase/NADH oxidase [Bacteroidetes bacterium]|nr:NADH:flavin oxidoreductase/NADH oxidase [Bacteroidota bacterium]
MTHLFTPLKLREVELKNRIAVSPMCQYSSHDGFASEWHLVHLGSRAVGGAGLVMSEATGVSPEGRISIDDLGIWKDEHIAGLQKVTRFIREHNSVPGIQLAHAGRKASRSAPWNGDKVLKIEDACLPDRQGGWKMVAPGAIPFAETDPPPVALTMEGIEKVIHDFRDAAVRADKAGFLVAEIHAAHGYLIHEFLSPLCNQRTDDYGGSFENRIRLLIEVVENVRAVWPEKNPVIVRISCTDWAEGGWTLEESVALAGILKEKGVDLIDCSSGGAVPWQKIAIGPGYQVPFAEEVRKRAGILTGAVGLITTADQAESILANGQADLVSLAREFLRDPYFPLHAAVQLGADIDCPNQYLRAKWK